MSDPNRHADTSERDGGDGIQAEDIRAQSARRHRLRSRSTAAAILALLAVIATVLAGLAVWLHRNLLDTENFTEIVTPVVAEQAVTDALGTYLTDQAFTALQVEERVDATLTKADDFTEEWVLGLVDLNPRIEDRLLAIDRPQFADLTEPLVTAAHDSVQGAVQDFLASQRFQETFVAAVTRGHAAAVALLRGDYEQLPRVVVDTRSVRLDLTPAVVGVVQRAVGSGVGFLGFDPPEAFTTQVETPEEARRWMSETLGFDPPSDFASITIMSADRLKGLQGSLRTFDRLVWMLVAMVVVLIVAAIWVSPRRPRTLIQLGIGVALATMAVDLGIRRLEQVVADAFGDPAGREAARAVIAQTVSNLAKLGLVIAVAGALVALGSFAVSRGWHQEVAEWLGTSSQPRSEASRLGRFVGRHLDLLRLAGAVVALAIVWVIGVGLWSVVIVGLLLIGYLVVLSLLGSGPMAADDAMPAGEVS